MRWYHQDRCPQVTPSTHVGVRKAGGDPRRNLALAAAPRAYTARSECRPVEVERRSREEVLAWCTGHVIDGACQALKAWRGSVL